MNTYFTPYVKDYHPELKRHLDNVLQISQELDQDIQSDDLFVAVKCAPLLGPDFGGSAWPFTMSRLWRLWGKSRYVIHKDGKIMMYLSPKVVPADIALLFGHELRHIGQFHRSKLKLGYLSIATDMTKKEAEDDCEEFEQRVIDRFQ